MIAEISAAIALALAALAEWLHARRIRRVAPLAFGPNAAPASWTKVVPALRGLALGALAWGLVTLYLLEPRVFKAANIPEGGYQHLLVVLDVSPSMQLKDAGPAGQQTRAKRAAELLLSIFERIILEQVRVSVVAVYSSAKPVVVDTHDLDVVKNILNDLPLDQAFSIGKTKLIDGVKEAAELAKRWQPASTTLLVVSDGDTVPDKGMPRMPLSIGKALVVGVGDARAGRFIDGHQSRQDASTLRQLAARLGGAYHDGNEKHLASEQLRELAKSLPMQDKSRKGKRELALAAVASGGVMLAILPIALALAGSSWHAGRQNLETRSAHREPLNRMGRDAFHRVRESDDSRTTADAVERVLPVDRERFAGEN